MMSLCLSYIPKQWFFKCVSEEEERKEGGGRERDGVRESKHTGFIGKSFWRHYFFSFLDWLIDCAVHMHEVGSRVHCALPNAWAQATAYTAGGFTHWAISAALWRHYNF